MKPVNFVTVAAFAAFTLPALGQTSSTPRIDQRQANQERRIEQGEKSGALTNKEAARLEKGQARVQKMENKALADGKVTAKERARIEKAQDHQPARAVFPVKGFQPLVLRGIAAPARGIDDQHHAAGELAQRARALVDAFHRAVEQRRAGGHHRDVDQEQKASKAAAHSA